MGCDGGRVGVIILSSSSRFNPAQFAHFLMELLLNTETPIQVTTHFMKNIISQLILPNKHPNNYISVASR